MTQTQQLIETLKRSLKAAGFTYADVAEVLELSEPSVKRLFSERDLSLARMERICQLLEMDFSDVVRLMNENQQSIRELTHEQEQELVANTKLLLVAVSVVNRWPVRDIVSSYQLEENECVRLLAQLDRLRLIELLPGNRVKLLVDSHFRWIENGPIQRFFAQQVQSDFFHSHFNGPGELFVFRQGKLSEASNDRLQKQIQKLTREFEELNREDQHLPVKERLGRSLCVAIRPWELEAFAKLRR